MALWDRHGPGPADLERTTTLGGTPAGMAPVSARPRSTLRGRLRRLMPVWLLGLACVGAPAGAAEYRLGPQDKVRLRVYEWRATQDQLFEWEALGEEFTVGADGAMLLPVAGSVVAAGRTPAELADVIADRLQRRLGLAEKPDTSLNVTQFRPFYIVGQVDKPGEYPFRPDLTVLQALTIGGGLMRVADAGLLRLERDAITAQGEMSVLMNERDGLLVRQARLEAERKGLETFEVPPFLKGQESKPGIGLIMTQETQIFRVRWESFKEQTRALEQLKVFFAKEIESIEGQLATQDTQTKLFQKELQSVAILVEKGLTAAPRQLALERNVAQLEGDRLRLDATRLKAQQEIGRASISILELRNKRIDEIVNDGRKTAARLEELNRRLETTQRLIREAEVTAPRFLAERARAAASSPVYTIIRVIDGKSTVMPAAEDMLVEPGDTVKVEMPSLTLSSAGDVHTSSTGAGAARSETGTSFRLPTSVTAQNP